jgi:hypothetical protein
MHEYSYLEAFIISRNLHRRNMNKGQQAMALAMIYPEGPGQGSAHRGRRSQGDEAERSALNADLSIRRLRQARQLLRLNSIKPCAAIRGDRDLARAAAA